MDFHTLGVPFSVINAFFRRRSSCFHYLAITMPPARGMGLLPPARPDRPGHPQSREGRTLTSSHRNATRPRLRSSRTAALTANGPPSLGAAGAAANATVGPLGDDTR